MPNEEDYSIGYFDNSNHFLPITEKPEKYTNNAVIDQLKIDRPFVPKAEYNKNVKLDKIAIMSLYDKNNKNDTVDEKSEIFINSFLNSISGIMPNINNGNKPKLVDFEVYEEEWPNAYTVDSLAIIKYGNKWIYDSDKGKANKRSTAALYGIKRIPGMDRHESPYKSVKQGGEGAIVRHIPIKENVEHGAAFGSIIRTNKMHTGDTVRIILVPNLDKKPKNSPAPVTQPAPSPVFNPFPIISPIDIYKPIPRIIEPIPIPIPYRPAFPVFIIIFNAELWQMIIENQTQYQCNYNAKTT